MTPLNLRAVARGAFVGLIVIVPIAAGATILKDNVDPDGAWLALPFFAILFTYVFVGFAAATYAPEAPLSNGAVAALVAFGGYLLVRVLVPVILSHDIDVSARSILLNAILATAFGMLGGALRQRDPRDTTA